MKKRCTRLVVSGSLVFVGVTATIVRSLVGGVAVRVALSVLVIGCFVGLLVVAGKRVKS